MNGFSSTSATCFKHETVSGLTSEVWTPGQSCWTHSPPRPPQLGPAPLHPLETLLYVQNVANRRQISVQSKLDLSKGIKTILKRSGGNRIDGFTKKYEYCNKTDCFVSSVPPIRRLNISFFKNCPTDKGKSFKMLFFLTVLQTKENP